MSTEILAIACDQQILRSYTLPFTGSVLVRNGQEVEAGQLRRKFRCRSATRSLMPSTG